MTLKQYVILLGIILSLFFLAGCIDNTNEPGQKCSNVVCKDPWGPHYYNYTNVTDFKKTSDFIIVKGYTFKDDGVIINHLNCKCAS